MRKFTRVKGPIIDEFIPDSEKKKDEEENYEKLDVNSINVVVDRIKGGLVGSLRIEDDVNKPLFKTGDIVHFRMPEKLQIKDFVLYKSMEHYFVRRIIKFKEYNIYVSGDNENMYRIIHKEDVIGKAIGRQRKNKYLSLSLGEKKKLYTFKKVNLAYFRLKNRVTDYESDINKEVLATATANLEVTPKLELQNEKPQEYKGSIDLDSDLKSFIDPDQLVRELEKHEDETVEEEIQYVDENGNVINPEDISEDDTIEEYEESIDDIEDENQGYVESEENSIISDENE